METIRTFLKPVIDLQATGDQIKRLRKLSGFSVHEVQQVFGFEYPQAVYAWEQGKSIPTIDNLVVLSQLFKVEVGEIIVVKNVEVTASCSAHAASCMNDSGMDCRGCSFRKTA